MECRDAQFYLRLRRHAADELGPDVTGTLDSHLATCAACAADARAALSFDRALTAAMRSVPVPSGLREKLFTQAAAKQGAVLRGKLYRAGGLVAAGLLVLGIGFGVFSNSRPKVDSQVLIDIASNQSEQAVSRFLVANKLPDHLPMPFDYDLLMHFDMGEYQGQKVPVIVFRSPNGDNGFAKVYIFKSDSRFDLRGLQDAQGSQARAQVLVGQGAYRGATYVFVHTGRDLQPFLRTRNGGGNPA
ncbi:MAG: DUF3379 domain-containing protein [Planctomycetes bacterium]|nr:DUF3379 domain-containing protein [Planctomycetota bacterium]